MEHTHLISEQMKQENYSTETIRIYISFAKKLPTPISKLTSQDLRKFISLIKQQGKNTRTAINAINYIYTKVFPLPNFIKFKNPLVASKKPIILSHIEVENIVKQTKNHTHKTIINLAYGCGLSVREILNIKIKDLNFKKELLRIGRKETILPEILHYDLSLIAGNKQASDFLFSLTSSAIQKFFKICVNKSNLQKPITFQSLKQSFTEHSRKIQTPLQDPGTDYWT